jgi:hypothetical protein
MPDGPLFFAVARDVGGKGFLFHHLCFIPIINWPYDAEQA